MIPRKITEKMLKALVKKMNTKEGATSKLALCLFVSLFNWQDWRNILVSHPNPSGAVTCTGLGWGKSNGTQANTTFLVLIFIEPRLLLFLISG